MQIIAFILSTLGMLWLAKKMIDLWRAGDDADEPTDFDLLSVSERVARVDSTTADLHHMEQLLTDLSICTEDSQIVIGLSWVGEDGEEHSYDLYCSGVNLATECMQDIAEREIAELRAVLSSQCAQLAADTRRGKNGGKNDTATWMQAHRGRG